MLLSLAIVLALHLTCSNALQMASLGSSFAAGPGISQGRNYASLVAAKLNARLSDLSVSGSTLLTMVSQIRKIPADTDIVTITSGGNDLGYVAGLSGLSVGGAASVDEAELVARWSSDLSKIHAIAPKAKVFLVEYLTMLGSDAVAGENVPFNGQKVEQMKGVAATLLSGTRKAAVGKEWVVLVDTARDTGHGVGSREPWVNGKKVGSEGGVAWHPNRAGHQAVADMVYKKIVETMKVS